MADGGLKMSLTLAASLSLWLDAFTWTLNFDVLLVFCLGTLEAACLESASSEEGGGDLSCEDAIRMDALKKDEASSPCETKEAAESRTNIDELSPASIEWRLGMLARLPTPYDADDMEDLRLDLLPCENDFLLFCQKARSPRLSVGSFSFWTDSVARGADAAMLVLPWAVGTSEKRPEPFPSLF